jgi:ATP-dependent RNA helicase DHX57
MVSKRVDQQLQGTQYSVGYRIMNEVKDNRANICFVTTGYLVNWIAKVPNALKHLTHLVLDEAHERSVDMDLLSLLLRKSIVSGSCTFKLIIMR